MSTSRSAQGPVSFWSDSTRETASVTVLCIFQLAAIRGLLSGFMIVSSGNYCLLSRAKTPGSCLPSSISRKAPPPVEI